jgi:hypothetical protein
VPHELTAARDDLLTNVVAAVVIFSELGQVFPSKLRHISCRGEEELAD